MQTGWATYQLQLTATKDRHQALNALAFYQLAFISVSAVPLWLISK